MKKKTLFSTMRGVYISLIFAIMYLPVAVMIALSFNKSNTTYEWTGLSLHKYRALFSNESIMEAVTTTLSLGLIAAAIATVIGTLACVAMLSMKKRQEKLISSVANIPLLNVDIVTGISLMLFFAAFVTRMNNATLLISHITLIMPYVVLNVYPKLRQFDKSMYQAALDLGASPIKAFFKVVLPDIFPGLISGFLLALTISIDDFTITYFTKGQGTNTLSTLIYTNRIRGILPEYYALTSLLFLTVLLIILAMQVLNMRSAARKSPALPKGKDY